jgi:hypothetical protein
MSAMHRPTLAPVLILLASALLSGCDMLGIETPAQEMARKDAEGKAIGSACRHAVRSVEDCFRSNPKAGKAAVFDGWKEMDVYMRENEIVGMPFTPPASPDEDASQDSNHEPAADKGRGKAEADPNTKKTHKS